MATTKVPAGHLAGTTGKRKIVMDPETLSVSTRWFLPPKTRQTIEAVGMSSNLILYHSSVEISRSFCQRCAFRSALL